jgi:UPF0755 protein
MKRIISEKYTYFVRYTEIILLLCAIFLLYNYFPLKGAKQTLYLPNDPDRIIEILRENGYSITPVDKIVMRLIRTPKAGWYSIDPNAHGRFLFFEQLYKRREENIMHLPIYPGETRDELVRRLAHDMKLDPDALMTRYNMRARFKEGDIVAGEYLVARDADANATIDYLFMVSLQRLRHFWERHHKSDISSLEQLTLFKIASIIQKESNLPTEMPLISSVIYNRIDKDMKLQMDSTLNYGPYAHTVITPERIKNDTSTYNTYKYKGLPPHPLSTFSIEALEAALHPADTTYLFFMLTHEGSHHFSPTYKEHLSYIRKFRSHQKNRERKQEKTTSKTPRKKSQKEDKNSADIDGQKTFTAIDAVIPKSY